MARHCEARSAVAISAVVSRPMDRFVPRDDEGRGAMTGWGAMTYPFRHCEARSAVAILAVLSRPMDRFVPRDDEAGCDDGAGMQ